MNDMTKVLMRCVECGYGITQNWEGHCGWIDSAPYCWPCFTRSTNEACADE